MNKKLKTLMLTMAVVPVATVCVACFGNPTPPTPPTPAHVHSFSPLSGNNAIDFCEGCSGYLVKGTGSEYLEAGESAQTLEAILTDENVQPVDGKMNFIISGSVDYDASYKIQSTTFIYDLAKSEATEVNISGCGENPELTLVTGDGGNNDGAEFCAGYIKNEVPTANLNVTSLKVNDTRNTSSSSWELTNTEFVSKELYLKDCVFTNCVEFSEVTKVTMDGCEFDFNVASRYSVWVGAAGEYSTYVDNVETFVIKNCTFNNTTRGIKILTSGADITIEGNTFIGLTEKPGILLDSTMGDDNTVLIKNNTFTNCAKGDWNSTTNEAYNDPSDIYDSTYFTVTVEGNVINNNQN